jgi:hypothetical protein
MEKNGFSVNSTVQLHIHMQKNEVEPLPQIKHKN